jgi:hypothetical protein
MEQNVLDIRAKKALDTGTQGASFEGKKHLQRAKRLRHFLAKNAIQYIEKCKERSYPPHE